MGITYWQASMWSAVKNAAAEDRFDLLNLYLKLEKVAQKHMDSGGMTAGASFRVPLESGSFLKISFYKTYSTAVLERPDGERDVAISQTDSYRREYRYLEATSKALKEAGFGIGPRYSREFLKKVADARPGTVLVFDSGASYMCNGAIGNVVSFSKTCGETTTPLLSKMKLGKEALSISVDKNSAASVQAFYRTVKCDASDDVKLRITEINSARQILNSLVHNIEDTKELKIGPNKSVVQKNKEGRGLAYLDSNGKKISEERVLLSLAWLEASPNRIEIKRFEAAPSTEAFLDEMTVSEIEKLVREKDYAGAVELAKACCFEAGDVFELDVSSYVKEGSDYEAVSYLFKGDDGTGRCVIKKVRYNDDNFEKNVASVSEVSEEEVASYLREKYDEHYRRVKSSVVEECFEEYPSWHGEFFATIVDRIASQRAEGAFCFIGKSAEGALKALAEIDFDERET